MEVCLIQCSFLKKNYLKQSCCLDGKSTAVCERFEVLSPEHKLLFFVDSDQIGFKLEHLRILGKCQKKYLTFKFSLLDDGGSVFEGAIQTASIQPEPDVSLRLVCYYVICNSQDQGTTKLSKKRLLSIKTILSKINNFVVFFVPCFCLQI